MYGGRERLRRGGEPPPSLLRRRFEQTANPYLYKSIFLDRRVASRQVNPWFELQQC